MAKASTILKSREQEEATKTLRKQQEKLLRHRLLGALVIFSVAFFLWEIGGVLPPQQILRGVPAAETLFPEEEFFAIKKSADEDIVFEEIAEESIAEESIAEESIAEESITEESIAEESVTEESVTEEPVTEEPVTEEPVTEESITEESVTEEPVTEEPVTEEPVTEEPVIEELIAEGIEDPLLIAAETTAAPSATVAPIIVKEETSPSTTDNTAPTDAPTANEEAAITKATNSEFIVQVGAFKERERADAIMEKIKQRGLTARQKSIVRNNVQLWRVRIGPYKTRAVAEKEQKILVELGFSKTQILALPANN